MITDLILKHPTVQRRIVEAAVANYERDLKQSVEWQLVRYSIVSTGGFQR